MALFTQSPSSPPLLTISRLNHRRLQIFKSHNLFGRRCNLPCVSHDLRIIYCANTSRWEPAPVTYVPEEEEPLLKETSNIFETISSSSEAAEASSITKAEQQNVDANNQQPVMRLRYLRRTLWLLGPTLLLVTGVVPTLWLPISSIFLGPNIASLLSLTGLDCIFNLGATLFLLMADSTARPNDSSTTEGCSSQPPSSYKYWNIVANVTGFIIPLAMLVASQRGLLQPQLPFISHAVLLGPYFLLLLVQMVTEMLTWHWKSPVWLVTPVVYESYRLLQLMRGLKLGAELGAASWVVHMIRGLVCCWVLVLGVQLMRVAWYAGFTARAYQHQSV